MQCQNFPPHHVVMTQGNKMTETRLNYLSGTIGATPVVLDCFTIPAPVSITVIPDTGDTVSVETSTTVTAVADPATATWLAWPSGTVSQTTRNVSLGRIVALRFTRVTGTGTDKYEVA
jgi:hypothetical protein